MIIIMQDAEYRTMLYRKERRSKENDKVIVLERKLREKEMVLSTYIKQIQNDLQEREELRARIKELENVLHR